MLYDQNGNGGTMGFSHPSSQRNIVVVSNDAVALHFQRHMEQLNVRFQQLEEVPQGVRVRTITMPDKKTLEERGRMFWVRLRADQPFRPAKRKRGRRRWPR
jgi:hypothetical protein